MLPPSIPAQSRPLCSRCSWSHWSRVACRRAAPPGSIQSSPCARNNKTMSHLRFAFRQVIKNPAFSAVAIITLALGIGANTAIFSIVNAVLLRPLPYPDADRIMVLNESSGPGQDYSVALPDYFDWQHDNTVFEHLAATHKESRNLSGIPGRDPERVSCAVVTRNFFNIIGLPTEIGRANSEEEDN